MNVLFKTIFGSRLYGTKTDNSDLDYKAVYAPALEDLVLGKVDVDSSIRESNKVDANTKSDSSVYEVEYYTLHKFLKHVVEGQTIAIDMLYAPPQFWVGSVHSFWVAGVVTKREKFLSKNLGRFVQYAVRQAAKYGIKGSRLNTASKFLRYLESVDKNTRLVDIASELELLTDEHSEVQRVDDNPSKSMLVVCGKKFPLTVRVCRVLEPLGRFVDKYGKRAELAAEDEGVDKKACSHAFRAAFEVRELVMTRNLVFPLRDRQFLVDVKTGKLAYKEFAPMLEDLIDEVSNLVRESDLPETPQVSVDDIVREYYSLHDNRV